ncbi:hypothetical protein GCM10022217_40120 [Chryseobacterium ginsenosidimutans]|uniref:hypothetical protein n=1 Tax=Chryseobacterium ginsenosidimutans TaxID=687846 RepID=UPI0031DFA606
MNFNSKEINYVKLFTFSEEQKKQVFKVYDRLCKIYNVSVIDIKDSPLFLFKPLVENQNFVPQICYLIKSENNSFYLYIIIRIVHYKGKYSDKTEEFLEVWGIKKLDEDFGDILIRKENFSNKITELFKTFDIDFNDDPQFSKTFYVLGENEAQARIFLSQSRRRLLKSFPDKDFQLEVKNNILSFGLPKKLSIPRVLEISKFLKDI